MFPAYGGRGGGSRSGPNRRGNHHHHHQHGHDTQEGPSSSFGYMVDRGDARPPSNQVHGRGGYHGGYNNNSGNRNRRNEPEYTNPSDDDNEVEDAVAGRHGHHKRKRHKSHSRSHSSGGGKKKRRSRSRSRSPHNRHRERHDQERHQQDRHGRHNQGQRSWNDQGPAQGAGGSGGERDNRRFQQQGGRWNRDDYQQQNRQQQDFGRNDRRDWGQQQGHSGWNLNNPPPSSNPWAVDVNPFDQHQQQNNYGYQRNPARGGMDNSYDNRGRGRDSYSRTGYDDGGRVERVPRRGEAYESQEERRVRVSQNFPKKVFLEEVELGSEFAFRLDNSANPGQLNYRSLGQTQKSTYEFGRGIFGASEDEMSKVYSVFHSFRCKLPDTIDSENGQSSEESEDNTKTPQQAVEARNYISFGRSEGEGNSHTSKDRFDMSKDFDSYSFERKEGEMSVKDKVEYYNKEVRSQPQNISMWKEFVQFQDKVFEESNQIFEQEGDTTNVGKKKKKSNRKALLEKKISILEKALETNPKNMELHLLRLEYLLELYKPRHVLTEWKKLVTQYQQIAPFWVEYLLFSASQLLVYTNSSTISIFETCFQKFHLMLNPQYPEFQRPKKFPLLISDITFAQSLLLKNAGFMERAVAIHQAQLEFDFSCPNHLFKDQSLLNWRDDSAVFQTFWDAGTPRFGEVGAKGWVNFVDTTPDKNENVCLPDSTISEFEDEVFDTLNEEMKSQGSNPTIQKPDIWLSMESCRSKLYWTPWRVSCSDVDDCEDAQRVVPFTDIINFICPVPSLNFISDFDKQAVHFRHILNYLMTLREDFMTHTQTVDIVCSPFVSVSLTESSSLFSEIYFWRRLVELYVGVDTEPASKSHHVFAPEGFKLLDLVSPNIISSEILRPSLLDLSQKVESLADKKCSLLKDNDEKFMEMFHNILMKGVELLDAEFASVLFEIFLRFEQKITCTRTGDVKKRIKFAKEIMKQEKIRNSLGGYREMAMLEYFGGNTKKAVDLLVKSINVTGKSLHLEEWDQIEWETNWKKVVDLISLYRQLAELYLLENGDSKAYYTLVQLGTCFQPIEIDSSVDDQWKPKTNILLKVTRSFEKIMSMIVPGFQKNKVEPDEKTDKDPDNQIYLKWGGDKCIEFFMQQRNFIVELTTVYAMFQLLGSDFDAASQVYEGVMSKISGVHLGKHEGYNPEIIRIHIREQLYINWCNLAARCLNKDPLLNSKFRNILGMALQEFPSSPPLLLLFTDVENQTSVAGKLWRLMMANMKQDSEKVVTHWAPLIMGLGLARKIEELEHDEEVGLPSFGIGGPAVPQDTIFYKLDSMISVAELHPGARHCPLLWRVHLKLLALRAREGKDVQRARAVFYDAIRHCPSSKAIYLDGVTYFPDLIHAVNDLFVEKQLLIRLPLEELDVLLETDEAATDEPITSKTHTDECHEDEEDRDDKSIEENQRRKARESKSEGELGDSSD